MPIQFTAFVALLCACFAPSLARADRSNPLFQRFPQTEVFTLQSGEKVLLPLHDYQSQGLMIGGSANLASLREVLRPQGLVPAKIAPGKGLVALYIIKYEDDSIAQYKEMAFLIAVEVEGKRAPSLFESWLGLLADFFPGLSFMADHEAKGVGFFAWKFWVNSDIALRVGHEVWGYPKTLADIAIDFSPNQVAFSLDENGEHVLDGNLQGLSHGKITQMPLKMDFRIVTPVEIRQTRSRIVTAGHARTHLFTRRYDQLSLSSRNYWGNAVSSVGFRPLFWQNIPDLMAAFISPEQSIEH